MNTTVTGTNIVISFPTQSGFNYQVQYKNNLTDTVWSPLNVVAGNNTVESVNDPATSFNRFYRVQIQ